MCRGRYLYSSVAYFWMLSAFLKLQFFEFMVNNCFSSPISPFPFRVWDNVCLYYAVSFFQGIPSTVITPKNKFEWFKNSSLPFCHLNGKKPEVFQLEPVVIFLSVKTKICSLMSHVHSDLWFRWKPRHLKNISWTWKTNSVGNPENKELGGGGSKTFYHI